MSYTFHVPQKIIRSAGYAFRGFFYAMRTERNFRFLALGVLFVLLLASFFSIETWEWYVLLLSCGMVLCTELLNTAIEHIADALDDYCKREHQEHCFFAIRHAKDTAAASSLVSFSILLIVICVIFLPHLY